MYSYSISLAEGNGDRKSRFMKGQRLIAYYSRFDSKVRMNEFFFILIVILFLSSEEGIIYKFSDYIPSKMLYLICFRLPILIYIWDFIFV